MKDDISPTQNWLLITLGMALSGVLYAMVAFPGEPVIIGAVFAVFMGVPLIAFERRIFLRRLRRRVEKLPTPLFILSTLLICEILLGIGHGLAGALFWSIGVFEAESIADVVVMRFNIFLYALAVCTLIVFILRVRDLLGHEVFTSMLTSRYRNPVKEERIFLIIDMADSTPFAEAHGDLHTQQFLKAMFAAFAEPVRRFKGAIDDYIGDAAIITWPMERGAKNARCIHCVFAILDEFETNADAWRKRFGQVPRLRAALHGGFIITAEIGVDHHKIAYFGDTVNTTARLESLCKSLNRPVLISSELAQRLQIPDKVMPEDLGTHAVKGRGHPLGVMALTMKKKAESLAPADLKIPAE